MSVDDRIRRGLQPFDVQVELVDRALEQVVKRGVRGVLLRRVTIAVLAAALALVAILVAPAVLRADARKRLPLPRRRPG
jgi:hypothetical protein